MRRIDLPFEKIPHALQEVRYASPYYSDHKAMLVAINPDLQTLSPEPMEDEEDEATTRFRYPSDDDYDIPTNSKRH